MENFIKLQLLRCISVIISIFFLLFLTPTCCICSESLPPIEIEWELINDNGTGWKGPLELPEGIIVSAKTEIRENSKVWRAYISEDYGLTYKEGGDICVIEGENLQLIDLGDGAFIQLPNGDILASSRTNLQSYPEPGKSTHSINVAISKDNAKTFTHHSTVVHYTGTDDELYPEWMLYPIGYWSTFIFLASNGDLQLYYDDEITPLKEGYPYHQWWMMRTWNETEKAWINPVVVSRPNNKDHLSRDGQGTVVEVSPGVLITAIESVHIEAPHKGCIRILFSEDYGKNWSWQTESRRILYAPEDMNYSSLCPWIMRMDDGTLLCTFMTDEDREIPDVVHTGKLNQSIKYVLSYDNGLTFTEPYMLDPSQYMWGPGVIQLQYGPNKGKLFYQARYAGTPRVQHIMLGTITKIYH